jgi:myo-inositol catabolism protein IolC
MALSGAALESYAELNPDMWRVDPIKDAEKWKDITCKGDL